MDEQVIEMANGYAKQHQTSLSKLIESYLHSSVDPPAREVAITPLVESLSGVITLPKDFDICDAYAQYLVENIQKRLFVDRGSLISRLPL